MRAQAQAVLGRVGLNISDAIRLFLRQVVVARGLPFEVREYPNAVTQAAMLEARQARAGYDTPRRTSSISSRASAPGRSGHTVDADRKCLEILGG